MTINTLWNVRKRLTSENQLHIFKHISIKPKIVFERRVFRLTVDFVTKTKYDSSDENTEHGLNDNGWTAVQQSDPIDAENAHELFDDRPDDITSSLGAYDPRQKTKIAETWTQ